MIGAEDILRQEIRDVLQTVDLSKAQLLAELRYKEALTTKEVEALFGYTTRQLQEWRATGRGPKYIAGVGKTSMVLYRRADIEEFQSKQVVRTYDCR